MAAAKPAVTETVAKVEEMVGAEKVEAMAAAVMAAAVMVVGKAAVRVVGRVVGWVEARAVALMVVAGVSMAAVAAAVAKAVGEGEAMGLLAEEGKSGRVAEATATEAMVADCSAGHRPHRFPRPPRCLRMGCNLEKAGTCNL